MITFLKCDNTNKETRSSSLDKTYKKFALKLYKDSNTIIFKTQIYSSLHNMTCFKYRATITKKCWFEVSHPCIKKSKEQIWV